ncbi:MAG: 50S ribosomal protein L18 [Chloroflexi bacterium]|nr:50S ribosomal protein L18 [Chloroflexota bacterium]
MFKPVDTRAARQRRHRRVRARISGTAGRPRLNVFRSLQHVYAQVIDDDRGHTLVAASSLDPELRSQLAAGKKQDQAVLVGRLVAERARAAGIEAVVFDRGGYLFHGRVKSLADAAREAGLKF